MARIYRISWAIFLSIVEKGAWISGPVTINDKGSFTEYALFKLYAEKLFESWTAQGVAILSRNHAGSCSFSQWTLQAVCAIPWGELKLISMNNSQRLHFATNTFENLWRELELLTRNPCRELELLATDPFCKAGPHRIRIQNSTKGMNKTKIRHTNIEILSDKFFLEICFIHVPVSDLYIPIIGLSIYSAVRKYVDLFWEYRKRSHTHEYGNWDWGRAIPVMGIHKWDFRAVHAGSWIGTLRY
jgi:hypothetical protein